MSRPSALKVKDRIVVYNGPGERILAMSETEAIGLRQDLNRILERRSVSQAPHAADPWTERVSASRVSALEQRVADLENLTAGMNIDPEPEGSEPIDWIDMVGKFLAKWG